MAGVLFSAHYTSTFMIIIENLGVFYNLKIMSLNPAHPNKRKHPRKIDTQTLRSKSRQASLAKTNFSLFFKQFQGISPEFPCLFDMLPPWWYNAKICLDEQISCPHEK